MKYKITLARTEYLAQTLEIEADSEEKAQEIAWDMSGKWKCVEAEEFIDTIERVSHEPS